MTYLPTDRSDSQDLEIQIEMVANNPVADGLMRTMGGMLAVVNDKYQVVAVNEKFLTQLGIDDPSLVLGLRSGETLDCAHAAEGEAGCGTSDHCPSCGAAIAMVTCLAKEGPAERICALTTSADPVEDDLALRVQAQPILIDDRRFILLFLQDITQEQQRAALERSFYHDMNNILMGLSGACQLLEMGDDREDLIRHIQSSSSRLAQEVEIQKLLFRNKKSELQMRPQRVDPEQILNELESLFSRHPAARNRIVKFPSESPNICFRTDLSLFLRVLSNMIINALEASDAGGVTEIRVEEKSHALVFSVWNGQVIPTQNQFRVFQRNFSTKNEPGRGFGTYSMKLFGEHYLKGRVSFESPVREGTEFRFEIPV